MQYLELKVPKIYSDPSQTGNYSFIVPVYDQNYKVSIEFPPTADGTDSFTAVKFPDYKTAYNLIASEKTELTWSGLLESDKDNFVTFLKSFNNSFQPFTLIHYDDALVKKTITGIIETDSVEIKKDEFDLYSISLIIRST
ncbi:MAG: hypothetical protein KatS3mg036_0506 [Ignavibacterium sp.]|uniref:hypothetical protein n=1 Tax=Ignavibacterium sp. TaxID=2651167 RepID=UPI0021DF17BE|nr:hypothetical protein [Ignavibacterium sp.]BDQ01952.1 MAG: hypothetical protein KatS3mg037_0527 [Ignavibacterium sp.]GIV45688.1 MAG: hypothetical protein KatS3mg036_0506 [Ignavibacterium sp.]